ncbi:MAG TPA: hypothetical protein VNL38_04260 [Candidatus Nitrosotenuis sp.]|nr:hypothetical protein [Candidatus Nitrosotenuis sp.]
MAEPRNFGELASRAVDAALELGFPHVADFKEKLALYLETWAEDLLNKAPGCPCAVCVRMNLMRKESR